MDIMTTMTTVTMVTDTTATERAGGFHPVNER
jgi:hypothetical protein